MFKKYFPEWGVERFHKFGKRFFNAYSFNADL